MGFLFATTDRGSHDRLTYWNELLSQHHGSSSCFPVKPSDFMGQLFVNDLGPSQVTSVSSGPASYSYEAACPAPDENEYLMLHLSIGGATTFYKSGEVIKVERGDLVVLDTLEKFQMSFSAPAQFVHLRFPISTLSEYLESPEDLAWQVLDGRQGLGAVLRAILSETAALERITETEQAKIFQSVFDMLATLLQQKRRDKPIAIKSDRLEKAKRYMIKFLREPNLNAEQVCHNLGLSPRTLYRLFAEEDTTFMRWLMEQRIDASYKALADGQCRDVTDAALSHGFKDLSTFSRSFRKQFRQSPRSVLKNHASTNDTYTLQFIRNAKLLQC
ncbi:AraC family transcriptional regulator [Pseudomonas fluorescens]|nr:AraC family transcriptional regulator [Pseudomonas fluorescens]